MDKHTGQNNIESATAARFQYYLTQGQPILLPFIRRWDMKLTEVIKEFNEGSEHIEVYAMTATWFSEVVATL